MVFAPKLEGGVAYNQPVETPNAMSAIAGLFNFGVQAATKGSGETTKLTEDEKFAVAVREFEGAKGATFQWDRKGMREFIFNYPQFTSQAKAYGENLGVMTVAPQEVARDAVAEWAKTPEGILAVASTSNMDTEEADAYIAQQFTNVMAQEAAILKLNRNVSQLEAEGKLQDTQWNALKTVQKSATDHVVSVIIAPAIAAVQNGQSVETPQALLEMGVTYDTLDMNTLPLALLDAQRFLDTQAQQAYSKAYGAESIPPQAWKDEVYGSLKPYLAIAETFDTPVERAAAMSAMVEIQAMTELDNQGLGTVMHLLKTLPPDTVKQIYGNIPELMAPLSKIMVPKEGGELFGREELSLNITNGSVADAADASKAAAVVLTEQMDPYVFHVFKEANTKSGYGVIDGTTWKSIISSNIEELNKLNTSDPEFRAEVSDFMVSDIQQTISVIENNLPSNMDLVNINGRFSIVMTGTGGSKSRAEAAMGTAAFTAAEINKALKALPSGVDVTALNEKVSSLPLMGVVGKEIQEAVGILNAKPNDKSSEDIFGKLKNIQPTSGTVTKSTKGSAGGTGRRVVTPDEVIGGLQDRGMPAHIAEGFAMNIADESAFDTGAVGDGGEAVGLIQWNGKRKAALEAFAASVGGDPLDHDVQLDFLMYELGGPESAAWAKISKATTAGEAAALIVNHFERPAEEHRARREAKYLGGAAGFELRSGEMGSDAPVSVRSDSASVDSDVMTTGGTPLNMPVEAVGGATEGLTAEQVAQLVERVKQAPEKAVQVVQEAMGGKPVDPMIKALIEALVGAKV
jgi:Phage tail lysozyme